MVFRGKYIQRMEVQIDHIVVVDPRQTCVLFFSVLFPILISNHFSGLGEERPLVRNHFSNS